MTILCIFRIIMLTTKDFIMISQIVQASVFILHMYFVNDMNIYYLHQKFLSVISSGLYCVEEIARISRG